MSSAAALAAVAAAGAVAMLGQVVIDRRGDRRGGRQSPRPGSEMPSTPSGLTSLPLVRWRPRAAPGHDLMVAARWCDAAASAVRSGATLTTALEEGTELHPAAGPAMATLLTSLRRGQPIAVAAVNRGSELAESTPDDPFVVVLAVIAACAELGGPAAAPLERTASTLRVRAALAEEQHAQSAQARLSAQVLTVVPLGLLGLLVLTAPDVRSVLTTTAGITVVALGGTLNAVGWWWMRRIVDTAVRR